MNRSKVRSGYQKFPQKEPFILEPEDWGGDEWATLCKLSGLPAGQTKRIVLHISEIEYYADTGSEPVELDKTHTVVEVCPHCGSEVEMLWNTDELGFKASCPICGKRLMLCDECRHTKAPNHCDYDGSTDTCRWNRKENT